MITRRQIKIALLILALGGPSVSFAQGPPDPAVLIAAQKKAMSPLSSMDGIWRGTATTTAPNGEVYTITQTERVGPFLDGSIKVIEGRGYDSEGDVVFNAFGIVSFDPAEDAYTMHSHARGHVGDFDFKPTDDGFVWQIPAGPMTLRYTAVIADGVWHEIGERITPGGEEIGFFEMTLERIGDTNWPAEGAVDPE